MNLAAFFFNTIPLLIQMYAERYEKLDKDASLAEMEPQFGVPKIQTYDFIIVGAGTAGSLLAGRLSEKFTVLLLEAGGSPTPMSQVPYYASMIGDDPATNYFFKSVPQANAGLRNGGIITVSQGKMLGGSGSHNQMVYMRGSPRDWDGYAALVGDDGYNYTNILRHYKNTERFVGTVLNDIEENSYGSNGPMTVDIDLHPSTIPWFAAGLELGYPTADANGLQRESFNPMTKLISRGQRQSTYLGYVKPYESTRKNLKVMRYSYAHEILIKDKVAYGVVYSRHGIPQVAHASREVIVSSGTFSSPLLLMRSGVGPEDVLKEAGIPVKLNAPAVGQNLQDHIYVTLDKIRLNSSAAQYTTRIPEKDIEAIVKKYELTGEGVLGEATAGPQALLLSERGKLANESDWPDSRLNLITRCTVPFGEKGNIDWCFYAVLDRPKSVGKLTLNATEYKKGTTDDTKLALIDFNYLGDSSDLDVLVDAIQVGLKVFEETKAFKELGAVYLKGQVSTCTEFEFRSREYWKCYVKNFLGPGYHTTGTCSMGTVVDKHLKVIGLENLRVVDGSVFPFVPNCNLNAPVIAIAEKTASDILAVYQ